MSLNVANDSCVFLRPPVSVIIHDYINLRSTQRDFGKQYATIYNQRLLKLKPLLEGIAKTKWPHLLHQNIASLCEYQITVPGKQHGTRKLAFREGLPPVVIIGTIFKIQPHKPTILDEFSSEAKSSLESIPRSSSTTKYISDLDKLRLEDASASVQLELTSGCGITRDTALNGLVCAMKGSLKPSGSFLVIDVVFPSPNPVRPLVKPKLEAEIVFISGIQFGNSESPNLYLSLLLDYLEGQQCSSTAPFEPGNNNQIVVVVLGNSFPEKSSLDEQNSHCNAADVSKRLDDFFDRISKMYSLFVLPGVSDPSNSMIPQPPLHACLFPKSSRRLTFKLPSNPARMEIPTSNAARMDCFLSSGETILDAMRNSSTTSSLEMAQRLMKWGLLIPNAPDTVPGHPGIDDVYLYNSMPHLYVIGNQQSFGLMKWNETRIVAVPQFFESHTIVVLSKNLDAYPLKFNTHL